jgi:hypothetical protein
VSGRASPSCSDIDAVSEEFGIPVDEEGAARGASASPWTGRQPAARRYPAFVTADARWPAFWFCGERTAPRPRQATPFRPVGHSRRPERGTRPVVIFRLELVTVPVSDVDPAKAFYVDRAGFSAEQDHQVDEAHRFVELI